MIIDLTKLFNLSEELDERMITEILKAFKEANPGTFDYIRFKQSVNALTAMDLDETKSIKSAFATASTMGFTKEELLKSAQSYLTILKKEREEFIVALKNRIESGVEQPKKEITEVKSKISDNEKKMMALQKENELLLQKITQLEEQMAKSQEKIDATKEEFIAVFDEFEDKIEEDKVKFEAVL